MGESFQDYSLNQDFEADFHRILNKADSNSIFGLFSVYLKTTDRLNLKLLIFVCILQAFEI